MNMLPVALAIQLSSCGPHTGRELSKKNMGCLFNYNIK